MTCDTQARSVAAHMATPKVLDLDADLDLGPDEPIHTKRVKILGEEVTIVCGVNQFIASGLLGDNPDAGALRALIKDMILPADWPKFATALTEHPAMRGEKGIANLWTVVGKLIEAASERPTSPPSGSPRSVSTRSTAPKSRGSTASGRAGASKISR